MIMTILIPILAFLLAVSILVTFHEFGHFWVARRLGVKVLRFSIGFGRRLISWKDKQGTEYVIAAIPLGGYVKMLDEREGVVKEEELSYAFNRKSVWARIAIVLAGPVFNFIFAIFAFWLMFMVGFTGSIPIVGEVKSGSIADVAGIQSGDQITKVDEVETKTWSSVFKQIMTRLGDKDVLRLEIKDQSEQISTITLNLAQWELTRDKPNIIDSFGIEPYLPPIPPIVRSVMANEPAEKAGFLEGDEIVSIEDLPVSRWQDFSDMIEKSPNIPLSVVVKRNNEFRTLHLVPRMRSESGTFTGFAGLQVKVPELEDKYKWVDRYGPIDSLGQAFHKTVNFITLSYKLIGKMILGDVGLHNLSGPITIAQGAGVSFLIGFQQYLNFLALISISLGVLNLLPIPMLDGGHLLYYCVELVTGKPVSEKIQFLGFKLGLLFLIGLTTVAFYNDIIRML